MKKITLKIEGMHCGSCVMNIEGELEDTEGIQKSKVNFTKEIAEIEYDDAKISQEVIEQLINSLGYKTSSL